MTPQDFVILAEFNYGPDWRARLPDDTGVRSDNVRRLIDGRRGIAPALAEFLLRRAADRWLLRGWADKEPPGGLSAETAADLNARISAARSWESLGRPSTPAATSEDP